GIQDAHNLAWKLRAVREGWADPALLDTYETERRPVAQQNADQSLLNAMKMAQLFVDLGIGENTPAARAGLDALLADPAGSERVRHAIAEQQEHFDMFGLQLGIRYDPGAIVPDGTPVPAPAANPVRDYVPTTRPGARLPHVWVAHGSERCSLLD